jgi:hypothetical protein
MPRKPLLLDQFGQPVASWHFWESADRNTNDTANWFLNGARDTDELLPEYDWRTLMETARSLFVNAPLLRGAVTEQARYAFPLEPHYTGADRDWGKLAKDFLYWWKKTADVRGFPFDCHRAARLRLIGRLLDGDATRIFVKVQDGSRGGAPRLQFVRGHRIGNGSQKLDKEGRLESGPWKGKRLKNGLVVDEYDRTLALCITTAGKSRQASDDQFVPESPKALRDMGGIAPFVMTFNPDFTDQCRGLSEVAVSLASLKSHKRWRENEERAQEIQSAMAVEEGTDTGENEDVMTGSDGQVINSATGSGLSVKRYEKGMILHVRANSGQGVKLLRPDRPGPGVLEFDNRTIEEIIYGMGWEPNFALLLKQPGGAWCRTILRKVNAVLMEHQTLEAMTQLREDTWALAHAIETRQLPAPKDGDFTSWDYQGPPRLSADSGHDATAKFEGYKLGLITRRRIYAEDGLWPEEQDAERLEETRARLQQAQQLHEEFPEFTVQECLAQLEQRFANQQTVKEPGHDSPTGDDA